MESKNVELIEIERRVVIRGWDRGWGKWGGPVGVGGGQGGITWKERPDVGDRGMGAANHIALCVPVQPSYMICTCTPDKSTIKNNK